MPGFVLEIGSEPRKNFSEEKRKHLLVESIEGKNYYVQRRTIRKFLNDKPFVKMEDFVIVIDGVVLNKNELLSKYRSEDFARTIIDMYKQNGENFFKEFKGSFSGALYDMRNDKWIIWTNHYGDKQIFYYMNNGRLLVASEINFILDYLRNNKLNYSLNKLGAYCLLTFGYMLEDNTLFNEIRKLKAGHYMVYKDGSFEIKQYYKLDNTPDKTLTEDEIIDGIEKLFRNAVKLEYEKDREYGYRHIASLSGGLDSRMSLWIAHELGFKDILIYCFSQSNYLDEQISKRIASDLGYEYIFKALDNGIYLKNLKEVVAINFGNFIYFGHSHVKNFVDLLNWDRFGILHTGQLGDVVVGTYLTKKKSDPFSIAYSKKLIGKVESLCFGTVNKYENEELFKFCTRGFNGILQGNLPAQEYTEVASPFLDHEFLSFAMKIPIELRMGHDIYIKWILKNHREAAKYKWEKIKAKITTPKIKLFGRIVPVNRLPNLVIRVLLKRNPLKTKFHMNPLDYWYETSHELRNFLDEHFEKLINYFEEDKELRQDLINLYRNGNTIEKTQALTFLEAYRRYFLEIKDGDEL